jgi:BirA family biotin operon repressor/biotin-[acetyl-CoA-carboxylase] ligase
MSAAPIGYPFNFLPRIDSTNLYAMRQIHARMAEHGTVFFTTHQTAGRGQRGKQWQSNPGDNLALSAVLRTDWLTPSHQFSLSAAMAVATRQLVAEHLSASVSIKWPNDIFVDDKKAGGILIENLLQATDWKWSVVGIGINVNQMSFADDLPWAVSLKMLNGQHADLEAIAKRWCALAQLQWERLCSPQSGEIIADYNLALYGANTIQRLKKGNVVVPCLVKRVTPQGTLVAGEHNEWNFVHGEVEWLR